MVKEKKTLEVAKETGSTNLENSFTSKQSRCRSLKKAEAALPNPPRKRNEIIRNLAKKYEMKIALITPADKPGPNMNKL